MKPGRFLAFVVGYAVSNPLFDINATPEHVICQAIVCEAMTCCLHSLVGYAPLRRLVARARLRWRWWRATR